MGVVAADRIGLLQGSQVAVPGRKAEADAPGQFGNGQAARPTAVHQRAAYGSRRGCPS